jgi:hypothetical protein
VDVVALGSADGAGRPLLAIGQATWGDEIGQRHVERLDRIRSILRNRTDIDASGCHLILFSGGGFADGLPPDVHLVDLLQLYA